MKNNILALWNFPPLKLCCWRLLSVLLRTFFFEFFWFFFFFDRTLVPVDALGHLLGSNPNWTGVMWRLMCRANSAYDISSAPQSSLIVSEGESQGRHQDTGVDLLANTIDGARTVNSLASWTDKDVCHGPCAITFGPHRCCPLWKKVSSPTCPLNGSFQSPNCLLKDFFTRQTGFFSRKWPDGGRFFEPWRRWPKRSSPLQDPRERLWTFFSFFWISHCQLCELWRPGNTLSDVCWSGLVSAGTPSFVLRVDPTTVTRRCPRPARSSTSACWTRSPEKKE